MKSFAVAGNRRGRTACLLLLSALLLPTHSMAASAASLAVNIRQINPDGVVQQATCEQRKSCIVPVDIQTGQTKEKLTVHVSFVDSRVQAQFQTPKGFLYAGTKWPDKKMFYETLWHRDLPQGKPLTEDVTLYLPAMPAAFISPVLDADHEAALKIVHQPVATLEIKAQQAP